MLIVMARVSMKLGAHFTARASCLTVLVELLGPLLLLRLERVLIGTVVLLPELLCKVPLLLVETMSPPRLLGGSFPGLPVGLTYVLRQLWELAWVR